MCRCLRIQLSGFHAWQKSPLSQWAREDAWQTDLIRKAWNDSGKVYGGQLFVRHNNGKMGGYTRHHPVATKTHGINLQTGRYADVALALGAAVGGGLCLIAPLWSAAIAALAGLALWLAALRIER